MTEPGLWDAYRVVRESGSVAKSSAYGGFFVLSRYQQVKDAARNHEALINSKGHRIPQFGEAHDVPLDFEGATHTSYRKPMAKSVTPTRVREIVPFLRSVARDIVEALSGPAEAMPFRLSLYRFR